MSDAAAATATARLPALFVNHGGGPMPVMGHEGHAHLTQYLKTVATELKTAPKSILVISAHWEEDKPTILATPKPPMLYDYYGFPAEAYELKYAASNSESLVNRIDELLNTAGIPHASEHKRGYDHGVFIPLMLMFPKADIPVCCVSLDKSLDPALHIKLGQALAPLRDEGVFIVGSGLSFHSFPLFGTAQGKSTSRTFDHWLRDACTNAEHSQQEMFDALTNWAKAPKGRESHPREDHLIPLLVCAGAGSGLGRLAYEGELMNGQLSGYWFD